MGHFNLEKNVIFKIQIHVTNNMGLYGPVINANEFHISVKVKKLISKKRKKKSCFC